MKVKIELSSILSFEKKQEQEFIFENYDEKFFPPRPKGKLSFSHMFKYWSEIFKEQKNIDYAPEYFDMNKNIGVMFEITKVD
jgi:hypothetical protein